MTWLIRISAENSVRLSAFILELGLVSVQQNARVDHRSDSLRREQRQSMNRDEGFYILPPTASYLK